MPPVRHAAPVRREVSVAGATVPVAELGEGPPVVLVSGLAGSTIWWRDVVPLLAERHRAVLVDLPGFGALGGHRRLLPIPEQTAWLAQLVAGLGYGPVDLVGYSYGGSVCARLAAARPELVRRLALVAPGGVPSARSAVREAAALLHMAALAGPRFWPVMARDVVRAGLRVIERASHDVRQDDARAQLPAIAAPTLIVWGERDTLVPQSDIEQFAAAIPGARVVTLPGVGHVPMAERPEALAGVLLDFLDG